MVSFLDPNSIALLFDSLVSMSVGLFVYIGQSNRLKVLRHGLPSAPIQRTKIRAVLLGVTVTIKT
jgi:hypothetical protein